MSHPPIITDIKTVAAFSELLNYNPGIIILKFGAEWCGPCKIVEPLINNWFFKMPAEKVVCGLIDIDDNFEIYGYLKNKRVMKNIPTLLCYYKDNLHYVPDDLTIGADKNEIDAFFERCLDQLEE